ncbi:MAG: hypothetical protein INH41_06685 [Myxococcaceae bacterium]|jgi:hypothetical protein|nr:hypothetical protein [Myxococcaceae bacterium]MCA3012076.1 hypothetical protein [Myxococcaceae bacterium]
MGDSRHHVGCDCEHHRSAQAPPSAASGWVASVLPVLACAVCPACLSAYAKLLSALGVGLVLTEAQHAVIMTVAVASSVAVSGWRTVRTRRRWPLLVSLGGASLVVAGHLLEHGVMEWAGVLVLLAGGLAEMPLLRRLVRRRSPAPALT